MNSPSSLPRGTVAVREALATLRRGWPAIVILCLIGAVAGGLYAKSSASEQAREIKVELERTNTNGTVVDLGISTPTGPTGSDLMSDEVLDDTARRLGIAREDLEGTIELAGAPGDPGVLLLQTDADFDQADRYLEEWLAAIVAHRKELLDQQTDRAIRWVEVTLQQTDNPVKRRELGALRDRIAVLDATLGSDVQFVSGPVTVTKSTGKSTTLYAAAGGIGGAVLAIGLLLLLVLVTGRVRTTEGLAAVFGALIVSDLSDRERGIAELRRWFANHDLRPASVAVLDGTGGAAADRLAAITEEWPEARNAGELGGVASDLSGSTRACLVLVRPGLTGIAERDRLLLELDQAGSVELVGLVLV